MPTVVMDADRIGRTLTRIAHEIVERNKGVEDLALVGVRTRGVPIARRIARALREITAHDIATGALDITLYRDDLQTIGPRPVVGKTSLPLSLDGRNVVIVDDVLYTGRTVRAAMDELADFGRPARIALAVLVDRGGRELPIHADVVGKVVQAASHLRVDVQISDLDGEEGVIIVPRDGEG
jgi:pyrimidine operon attenuation protein/uracil phosphoribosyltransferase